VVEDHLWSLSMSDLLARRHALVLRLSEQNSRWIEGEAPGSFSTLDERTQSTRELIAVANELARRASAESARDSWQNS
jgi:hypothetical protein